MPDLIPNPDKKLAKQAIISLLDTWYLLRLLLLGL